MSTDTFVIRQPAGQRTLALRESYLAICDGDACEAHLLNAHERWYAYKLKERDQNRGKNRSAAQGGQPAQADESLWVRMNAEGWVRDLLGLYNEKTIRIKLAGLVERSFLATRSSPSRKWDRTPQWLFQRANVQAAVDAWEAQRDQPDLDPTAEEVENDAPAHSDTHPDTVPECSRTNVRMESEKVPNQVGHLSVSNRTNVRSNNTEILTQGSFPDIQKQVVNTNVVNNAHAEAQQEPQAPSVAQPSPAQPTTSGNASLQNSRDEGEPHSLTLEALPLPHLPSPPTAVLELPAPDGVTANAVVEGLSLTDEEVEFIFGTGNADETKALEQVAGGGAATETAQEGPSEDETEPHSPEDTRAVLVPALGGNAKLNSFMEETPPGLRGKSRRAWITEIRPSRAIELVNQGRIEANAANPWTYIIQLLDKEIGSTLGSKSATKHEPVTALPTAFLTSAEKEALASQYPPVAEGEFWQSRKTGKVFEIEEVHTTGVFVVDLGEWTLQKFHATFEPAEASA